MTETKINKLKKIIESYGKLAVAFSGGTDSAFLLDFAHRVLGDNCIAISLILKGLTDDEVQRMKSFCSERGIRHIWLSVNELDIPGFAENPTDRCYVCKRHIFEKVREIAAENGIEAIVDGSNYDDLGDYRPGMKALRELSVESPLLMAGLLKSEIRALSKEAGLETWDIPSSPCLSSRVPYGERINEKKLDMIGRGESLLKDLGFSVCRVRCFQGDVAVVEIEKEKLPDLFAIRDSVEAALIQIGFSKVNIDEDGFKSGKLNSF